MAEDNFLVKEMLPEHPRKKRRVPMQLRTWKCLDSGHRYPKSTGRSAGGRREAA